MTDFHGYPVRVVGVVWFRKEDYPPSSKSSKMAMNLLPAWDEWVKGAEKAEKGLNDQGQMTERVYVDPDTFPEWCRKEGLSVGRYARNKFAAGVVAEKYSTRG